MQRCFWCTNDPLYIAYHDQEWGVPVYAPQALFELLLLEGFQAGLSWITVLKKREHYRKVLHGFDPLILQTLTEPDIEALMQDTGIIRNRLKLRAARQNARAWLALDNPSAWLWSFVGGAPLISHFADKSQVPAVSPEAVAMSCALKARGFSFVGPTICYAFMQAAGMVMDHTQDCFRYADLGGAQRP